MARITIIGSHGRLGSDLVHVLHDAGHHVTRLTHHEIEISDIESIELMFFEARPEIVINTASIGVEASELDPDKAFAVHAAGAGNLGEVAADNSTRVLQLSTDYVFDGQKGSAYTEADEADPINSFGASKLEGEALLLSAAPDALVIRSSGVYGAHHGRGDHDADNFVTKMLAQARARRPIDVVDDERTNPTSARALAVQIAAIVETPDLSGVVHASAHGSASWFEFAREIFHLARVDTELNPVSAAEFGAHARIKVPRPADSTLDNARLRELGLDRMGSWQEQLAEYLSASGARAPA